MGPPLQLPANTLRPFSIHHALKHYSDPSFVNLLCRIAEHGARIGYKGPAQVHIQRANHRSALANSNVVTEAIQKEVKKGRIQPLDE
jgi:hypothetical protein